MELDWPKKTGNIKDCQRQFTIEIRNPKTGELLRWHKVDFRMDVMPRKSRRRPSASA
jgi:hypothetical protein